MTFNSKEKQAILIVLSNIMKADGVVAANEKELLDNNYRELGINMDDFKNIESLEMSDCKSIFSQMSEEKRDYVSKCFLQMAGVDGRVDLRELRVIHDLF